MKWSKNNKVFQVCPMCADQFELQNPWHCVKKIRCLYFTDHTKILILCNIAFCLTYILEPDGGISLNQSYFILWYLCYEISSCAWPAPRILATNLLVTRVITLFPDKMRSDSQNFPRWVMFILCGKILWFTSNFLWKKRTLNSTISQ